MHCRILPQIIKVNKPAQCQGGEKCFRVSKSIQIVYVCHADLRSSVVVVDAVRHAEKGLVGMLNRLVEGALIVYEKDAAKGVDAPLPLQVLESSHFHALLIQDDVNVWRGPVLLSKDFLHNPMSIRQVSRCHALSGIVVRKVCRV